jgi:hypothetical protein
VRERIWRCCGRWASRRRGADEGGGAIGAKNGAVLGQKDNAKVGLNTDEVFALGMASVPQELPWRRRKGAC